MYNVTLRRVHVTIVALVLLTTQVAVNNNVINIQTVAMEAKQCVLFILALRVSLSKT